MKAEIELYLNTYKQNRFEQHPVSIKVVHTTRKYFPLKISLSESEFTAKKKTPDKEYADRKYAEALLIAEDLGDRFTFDKFARRFNAATPKGNSLTDAFTFTVATLEPDQIGTLQTYNNALQSFLKYKPKTTLSDISVSWVKGYERWMLEQERSITTVGIYLRNLRKVINDAIREGFFDKEDYPFGKRKYEIPTGKNTKKAIPLKQIEQLFKYKPLKGSTAERMLDYWIFTYIANGINVTDFCRLKWSDMQGDTITYVRAKTKRTKKIVKPIEINLLPRAKEIIRKYGNPKSKYIFPHMDDRLSFEEQDKIVANLVRLINGHVDGIANSLGIEGKVTTYYARHSFATVLKNSGASLAMISQLLGHASIVTTENYLASFDTDELKKATAALTNF